MAHALFHSRAAQVAKPGIAAVSKTAGRKAAQVQILPWALAFDGGRLSLPQTCRPTSTYIMSTVLNMMTPLRVEAGLEQRLIRLKGTDSESCVPEYAGVSADITQSPQFSRALTRARALSDERRMTAVALLRRRPELCACEIQAALGVTHATVSHHMAVLEDAGIVETERRGKWIFYRLKDREGVKIP